jgi:hypothetical protein
VAVFQSCRIEEGRRRGKGRSRMGRKTEKKTEVQNNLKDGEKGGWGKKDAMEGLGMQLQWHTN